MTSHPDPDYDATDHQADQGRMVIESIDQYLHDGMSVLDETGKKVGDVRKHSSAAGYLMVNVKAHGDKNLYIPFRLIRTIDQHEISLSAPKETLVEQYTQPPKMHTVVHTQLVPGPSGSMIPQARQVQTLESGYDAMPAELNSASVGSVASRLAVGMAVYDVDGVHLGDITQYDTMNGLLIIAKGISKKTAVIIPFSDVASFSEDNLSVYLSLARDTIMKEHQMLS